MSSRRRTHSSSSISRGNDKRRQSVTRADQSRNLSDNPSANPLSRPLTQEDIPNIVQQVLPDIVQQVLATLQPPESARVGQQMDTAIRSSGPQQSANMIEPNTTSSWATDTENQHGQQFATLGVANTEHRRSDPAATLPGLGKPSSELQ